MGVGDWGKGRVEKAIREINVGKQLTRVRLTAVTGKGTAKKGVIR